MDQGKGVKGRENESKSKGKVGRENERKSKRKLMNQLPYKKKGLNVPIRKNPPMTI